MAIVLGTIGSGTNPSRVRQWLNSVTTDGAALTSVGASDASPSLLTKASHGLQSGDVVIGSGFTANTNLNGGPFVVQYMTANTFKLKTLGGTLINGSGGSADTTGVLQRVIAGGSLKWHDIQNMRATLKRYSMVRNSDAQDPTYPQEQTIQSFFGS